MINIVIREEKMNDLAELLEQGLEDAVEVKNKRSLHLYTMLLSENIVKKSVYEQKVLEISSDIKLLTETMKRGFESVDKRFEDMYNYMNKRFDAVDKRFEDFYNYMNKRFDAVDKRFEDMNTRFEDMNKRFSMMFTFMNIGFGIIILITVLFKFIQ